MRGICHPSTIQICHGEPVEPLDPRLPVIPAKAGIHALCLFLPIVILSCHGKLACPELGRGGRTMRPTRQKNEHIYLPAIFDHPHILIYMCAPYCGCAMRLGDGHLS